MNKYIILISIYNDWKSVFKLLQNIDLQIMNWNAEVSVLLVNDFSTEERPKFMSKLQKIYKLCIKHLMLLYQIINFI